MQTFLLQSWPFGEMTCELEFGGWDRSGYTVDYQVMDPAVEFGKKTQLSLLAVQFCLKHVCPEPVLASLSHRAFIAAVRHSQTAL
jgi:hypothetical protein